MTAAATTRWPWIASVALAVAILAVSAFAVRTLVVAPAAATAPASSGSPAAAAPPSPTPAPAPALVVAGEPGVADLPGEVAVGVRGLYTALGTGDLAGLQARYAPDEDLDAAPWTEVAPLLADPAAREQLLAALREEPQRRAGLYRYAADGARVGVDDQGRMAFLVLP